jgi:hypothetical protein
MEELEKVYDEEIAPLMAQIIEISKRHKMPFFAEFQLNDEGFCRSGNSCGHPVFNHYSSLSQCVSGSGVNVDKYMRWVAVGARKEGHSSMVLHQMGIPERPEPREAN